MATEHARENSTTVTLFQRAHSRITTLQRVDEQLVALLDQRSKIQDELRSIQSLINEEFERVMKLAGEAPARMLSQIAEAALGHNGHVASRIEEAEAVTAG